MSFPCYIRYDALRRDCASGFLTQRNGSARRFTSRAEVQKAVNDLLMDWTPEKLFTWWKWEVVAADYTTEVERITAEEINEAIISPAGEHMLGGDKR
jgi:hypothetical protein